MARVAVFVDVAFVAHSEMVAAAVVVVVVFVAVDVLFVVVDVEILTALDGFAVESCQHLYLV